MQKNGKKLFSAQFWMICIACFASGYALIGLNAVVAVFVRDLRYGTSLSGMLSTLFTVSACVFRIAGGRAADRFGRRNVTATGAVILALGIFAYSHVTAVAWLIVFRIVQGAGFSLMSVGASTAFVDVIPPERLGEGIGYSALAGTVAGALAPSIGLALIAASGYAAAFDSMAGLVLLAAALTFALVNYERKEPYCSERRAALDEVRRERRAAGRSPAAQLCRELFEKKAIPPALLQTFMGVGFAAANVFIALFAVEKGYAHPGVYFTLMAVFAVLSRIVGGRWADRNRGGLCLYLGLALCIAAYFLLCAAPLEPVFYLSGALYGFGNGLVMPILNRIAVVGVSPARRGAATSTFTISTDIGTGIGSALWGVVIEQASFETCFLLTSLWLAVSVGGCFVFLRGQKKRAAAPAESVPNSRSAAEINMREETT